MSYLNHFFKPFFLQIEQFFGTNIYDVVFYLKDRGELMNAVTVSNTMNKVPIKTAENILVAKVCFFRLGV